MEWLIEEANTVRLSVFIGVLITMLLLEHLYPKRQRTQPRRQRWFSNFGLVIIGAFLTRLLIPLLAVDMAYKADIEGWGLFNQLPLSMPVAILLSIILLDLAIYWQHRLFHRIPLLWRLHRVHHCDLDLDASSAGRFHPAEIVLSMVIKIAFVTLIGAPVVAVIIFELLLNAGATFNHANWSINKKWDKRLRYVIVTPDMHRVHHSTLSEETNSNYGFFLSIWDYLFYSYIQAPRLGHSDMRIGLNAYQDPESISLYNLLIQPINNPKTKRR